MGILTPRVAVVQGASRGIGLGFVRHFLHKSPTTQVVALCRDPDKVDDNFAALLSEVCG
jgi:NAD(P)-dependent dehydrogenase (short-subunit alcohol dehydrogenase family)